MECIILEVDFRRALLLAVFTLTYTTFSRSFAYKKHPRMGMFFVWRKRDFQNLQLHFTRNIAYTDVNVFSGGVIYETDQ